MLPDYLPIVCLKQSCGDQKMRSQLFEVLRKKLAEKGVRIGVLKHLFHLPENEKTDKDIIQHITACDLLVVDGHCATDRAELVLGQHLAGWAGGRGQISAFFMPVALRKFLCAPRLFSTG